MQQDLAPASTASGWPRAPSHLRLAVEAQESQQRELRGVMAWRVVAHELLHVLEVTLHHAAALEQAEHRWVDVRGPTDGGSVAELRRSLFHRFRHLAAPRARCLTVLRTGASQRAGA